MTILLGLTLSVGVFFLADAAGKGLVERLYMSEEAVRSRNRKTAAELQHYVQANGISCRDNDAIVRWTIEQKNVYILLYEDQHLALEAGWWGKDGGSDYTDERLKESGTSVIAYPVQFPDGLLQAVVYDFSDSRVYTLETILCVILSALIFCVVMLSYNSRITRQIKRISRQVQRIGEGELELKLDVHGNDELSMLTASVEQMRVSILRKTQQEQQAMERNNELITAMSHDIRNPLTALLGYLDLAGSGEYRSAEELQSYIRAGQDKALQLKKLTDELFRYSLLFSGRELSMHPEEFDAQILLSQMLGEQLAALQQQGFSVSFAMPELHCTIRLDVQYLARVLDNLFDNIRKYADRAQRVSAAVVQDGNMLHIFLKNAVLQDPGAVESNRIGLQTCEKILSQMGGRFSRQTDGRFFSAEAVIPAADTNPGEKAPLFSEKPE